MKPTILILTTLAGLVGGALVVEAQRGGRDRTDPSGREPVPGITRNPAIQRTLNATATDSKTYILADCDFTVVDTGPDRGIILVDACTGDSWWYDTGWEAGTLGTHFGDEGTPGRYARDAEWRLIRREAVEE